jgi:hypothetical protein
MIDYSKEQPPDNTVPFAEAGPSFTQGAPAAEEAPELPFPNEEGVPVPTEDAVLPPDMLQAIEDGAPYALFVYGQREGEEMGHYHLHSNIPRMALAIGLGQFVVMQLKDAAEKDFDRHMVLRIIKPFADLADGIDPGELVQHPSAPIPGHLFHNAKMFVDGISGAAERPPSSDGQGGCSTTGA